jgi:DNA polymerase sigma
MFYHPKHKFKMKKIVFSLAFMLMSAFAFASTDATSKEDIQESEALEVVVAGECGFPITYNDGENAPVTHNFTFDCNDSNHYGIMNDVAAMLDGIMAGWRQSLIIIREGQ